MLLLLGGVWRLNFVLRGQGQGQGTELSLNPGYTTDELRVLEPVPSLLLVCERW